MRRLLAAGVFLAAALASIGAGSSAAQDTAPPAGSAGSAATTATTATTAPAHHVPVLAYYYIWFNPSSWNRAKTDLPLLGKYSSDDAGVILQHIMWAKAAGIDGFIVSWKSTPTLDRRLALLVDIAQTEHFSLEVIYEGLDFDRRPLPVTKVAADFRYFATTFARRAPFRLFPKPLLIWSGTWKYSEADIASVAQPVRSQLTVLASEKNVEGYDRVAAAVDGDAYYWSSVNPATNRNYLGKLTDMASDVHGHGGLWIAPAAPGFDAGKLGGTSVVARDNGQVFQRELAAARASAPDALGVISWNEFSENSQIEPSRNFGYRYLEVLASSLGRRTVFATGGNDGADSSAPGSGSVPTGLIVGPIMLALALIAAFMVFRRNARGRASPRAATAAERPVTGEPARGSPGARPV